MFFLTQFGTLEEPLLNYYCQYTVWLFITGIFGVGGHESRYKWTAEKIDLCVLVVEEVP